MFAMIAILIETTYDRYGGIHEPKFILAQVARKSSNCLIVFTESGAIGQCSASSASGDLAITQDYLNWIC